MVEQFVQKDADINENNKGDTALIRVANDLEHVNIAKKLVKDTSDVLIKNNKDANVIAVSKN